MTEEEDDDKIRFTPDHEEDLLPDGEPPDDFYDDFFEGFFN